MQIQLVQNNQKFLYNLIPLQQQINQPHIHNLFPSYTYPQPYHPNSIPMDSSSRIALPTSPQQKQALKQSITQYIHHLQASVDEELKLLHNPQAKQILQMQQKILTLQLRLKLIDNCSEFSLLRLNHLEQIFKYYCTHIFKIGKHMTFDRLEYERQHLNTERFFLFLRDFGLTVAQIDSKPKEIIPKTAIMTIFKKISSTSRDLSFEEFIKCLDKIAVIYYDEKSNYWSKLQDEKLERIKRKKEIEKRKIKRMKMNGQKVDQAAQQQLERLQNEQRQVKGRSKEQVQDDKEEPPNEQGQQNQQSPIKNPPKLQQNQQPEQQNNQNDDLIKEMMEDQNLQDPNEEINQIANQKKLQSMEIQQSKKNKLQYEKKLLALTNNQKIEYFYQMIGVDSVKEYKNKLTILNMTAFHKDKKETPRGSENPKNKTINLDDSSTPNLDRSNSHQDQERLQKLKAKLNQKKQKLKNQPIPKPKEVKESETAKQRRLMKEQREIRMVEKLKEKQQENDAVKQKTKDQKKNPKIITQQNSAPQSARPNFNQKQVNWQMLQKMNFDQLKIRQFHPTKLYHADDDDYIFMQEYGEFKVPNRARASRLEARERQSLSIVENVRKRADEVEKSERKEENKLNNKMVGRASFKGKL